jgi:hypothetical protein
MTVCREIMLVCRKWCGLGLCKGEVRVRIREERQRPTRGFDGREQQKGKDCKKRVVDYCAGALTTSKEKHEFGDLKKARNVVCAANV